MIAGKSGSDSDRCLPVGVMRAIYLRMLEILDPERIRSFWRSHPFPNGDRNISECELYRKLWDPFSQLSEKYIQRIFLRLEKFLHENGLRLDEFTNASFHRLEVGSYFSSENVLAWVEEVVCELHQSDQPRRTVLKVLETGVALSYPGSWCKVLSESRVGDHQKVICGFAPKPDFKSVLQFDVANFAKGMVKNLPNMFSMPSFEKLEFLSDARSPDQVFWEETRIDHELFLLKNEPFGKVMGFHQFIRPHIPTGLLAELGIPDWQVILLDHSYTCPIRKRIVAQKGTVLLAPLYLIEIDFLLEPFANSKPPDGNYLNLLIQGLSLENNNSMVELKPRHEQMVSLASDETLLGMEEERKAIFSDGIRVFQGTPALILRKILEDNADPGTRFYEYRWFKFDSGIFPNPKLTNIDLRLRRMQEKLAQVDLGIEFKFPGNGKLEVSVRKRIRLDGIIP